MKIGIDIDDVITDTSDMIIEIIKNNDPTGELHGCMEDIMRGDNPTPLIRNFYRKYSATVFENVKLKSFADLAINTWIKDGHEVFLITTRGEKTLENGEKVFENSELITLNYLKIHNIPYTDILFKCYDKAKACKENQINVMIDDSVKYCEEVANNNITSILFTSQVNQSIETNITRVNDWKELERKIIELQSKGDVV